MMVFRKSIIYYHSFFATINIHAVTFTVRCGPLFASANIGSTADYVFPLAAPPFVVIALFFIICSTSVRIIFAVFSPVLYICLTSPVIRAPKY